MVAMKSFRYRDPALGLAVLATGILGAIGLSSHLHSDPVGSAGSLRTGTAQAQYEDRFDQANPLRNFAIAADGAFRWGVFGQGTTDVIVGHDGWLFTAEEFVTTKTGPGNQARAIQNVVNAKIDLASLGVELIVLAIPDKASVYRDKLKRPQPPIARARHANFVSALDERGVTVIDATNALTSTRSTLDSFVRDDTHWSPAGARAVANTISTQVSLDLAKAVIEARTGPRIEHNGDLLNFVPTGVFRSWVGPEQTWLQTYETTTRTSRGLFDTAAQDVALVGTSFSANTNWHFHGFLERALQTEIVNYAAEGAGPFKPMQEMLSNENFRAAPPKLLIWEIPSRYVTAQEN